MNHKSINNCPITLLLPGKLYIITDMQHLLGYCPYNKLKFMEQQINKPLLLLKDSIDHKHLNGVSFITSFLVNSVNIEFISFDPSNDHPYTFNRTNFLKTLQQIH